MQGFDVLSVKITSKLPKIAILSNRHKTEVEKEDPFSEKVKSKLKMVQHAPIIIDEV